mmetsp:Transcript_10940/g.24505  ORF Transcript_10940/g.24505 Transcript_10940/m.24505 type:complete len:208 (+) Transcript_10940:3213-3836(+)
MLIQFLQMRILKLRHGGRIQLQFLHHGLHGLAQSQTAGPKGRVRRARCVARDASNAIEPFVGGRHAREFEFRRSYRGTGRKGNHGKMNSYDQGIARDGRKDRVVRRVVCRGRGVLWCIVVNRVDWSEWKECGRMAAAVEFQPWYIRAKRTSQTNERARMRWTTHTTFEFHPQDISALHRRLTRRNLHGRSSQHGIVEIGIQVFLTGK